MREYAEKGNTFIVGESFAVEPAARKVAKDYPKVSFLMGSSGKPQAPNFSVFDNYIQEPAYLTGMIAGGDDQDQQDRHGRRLSDSRSEPPDARVHGGRQGNRTRRSSSCHVHRLVVRSAEGEGSGVRDDREGRRRDVRRALRRVRRGQGARQARDRQRDRHAGATIPTPSSCPRCGTWSRRSTARIKAVKAGKFKAEDYGPYSLMKNKGSELAKFGTFEPRCRRTWRPRSRRRRRRSSTASSR